MSDELREIYEGTEPYLFISYSHQDSERVDPIIRGLQDMGYRVWYDTGIDVGSRWPDTIAEHLLNSDCVIAFISHNAMASDYCQEEIHFALEERKHTVVIYLEETTLSAGLRMRLCIRQAIYRYRFADDHAFLARLNTERVIQPSKRLPDPQHAEASAQTVFTKNTYMDKYMKRFSRVPDRLFIDAADAALRHQQFREQDLSNWLGCSMGAAHSLIQQMCGIGMIEGIGDNSFRAVISKQDWNGFKALIEKSHQKVVPAK